MKYHDRISAMQRLFRGELEAAYDTALEALAQDRRDPRAWGIMAAIALEGANHGKAKELATRAMSAGEDLLALTVAGRVALLERDDVEAQRVARLLLQRQPGEEPTLADTIGVFLVRTGHARQGLEQLRIANNLATASAQHVYNLAITAQFCGEIAESIEAFRRVLRLDPTFHRARLALAQLLPPDKAALEKVAALFESSASDADAALILGHTAARIAEGLGDDLAAFNWLDRAKAAKARAAGYDRGASERLFTAARAWSLDLSPPPSGGKVVPVFVVGMPRSGTTLVDRILSSHPAIASAGELGSFANAVKRVAGTAGPKVLDEATLQARPAMAEVAQLYRSDLAARGFGSGYVVDKMPFNFFFVPQILAALPEARIVVLRRDAADTCFANYRQLFATEFGYYEYAYDLEHCAHFVGLFEELMDHFLSTQAPRLASVSYEELVRGQEPETRRLIGWLGLDWSPDCLAFQENATPVSTASALQVRQPIYDSSIGRWRRYGKEGQRIHALLDRKNRRAASFAR